MHSDSGSTQSVSTATHFSSGGGNTGGAQQRSGNLATSGSTVGEVRRLSSSAAALAQKIRSAAKPLNISIAAMQPLLRVGELPNDGENVLNSTGDSNSGSPIVLKVNKSPSLPFNRLFAGSGLESDTLRSKPIGSSGFGMFRSVRRKSPKHQHTFDEENLPENNIEMKAQTGFMELKELQERLKSSNKR